VVLGAVPRGVGIPGARLARVPGNDAVTVCPVCHAKIAAHDLEDAWLCLAALSDAAAELATRTCGAGTPAALEREMHRPSPSWMK
jgi:hypothetical protein